MLKIKICLIIGCSQKKLKFKAPVSELNQGQLFKALKKLTIKNNFDLKILSGKHGLLEPNQIIEPYDQKIKNKEEIAKIRSKIILKTCQIWRDYDLIIIFMGKKYRNVLEPFFDNKFIVIHDRRGIGGYLSLISHYNQISRQEFLEEIKIFRIIECANYLWSMWDFNFPKRYVDVNRPHCCIYCHYSHDNTCQFSEKFPILYKNQLDDEIFSKSLLKTKKYINLEYFIKKKVITP